MRFVKPTIYLFLLLVITISGTAALQAGEKVTLGAGTVIRVALAEKTPIGEIGEPVEARVIEPVYVFDKLVVPVETRIFGTVAALNTVSRGERILAMTGGDFTPIRHPEIRFDRMELPDGQVIEINTAASYRNTKVVGLRDRKSRRDPLLKDAKDMAREKLGFVPGGPSKLDLIKNELFSYLPYHPQYLDRGSPLDAVLAEPASVELPFTRPADTDHLGELIPNDTLIHARLVTELSSNTSTKGSAVEAVLTEPVWGPAGELIYPEGTKLVGRVLKSKKAGWFGRSGELRFVFESIQLPAGVESGIKSQIEALETQRGQNVTLDAEGGTSAHLNNRFISPVFNFFAADFASKPSSNRIKRAVVSNGFKIVGRVAGLLGTQNVSTGLSYFGLARSVYTNLINKGPEATFPVNTRLEIRVSQRR